MNDDTPDRWQFSLARDAVTDSARVQLAISAVHGDLVRVARGAYLPADVWNDLTPAARYRSLMRAVALTARERPVFAHTAAAALWRLPRVGRWPVTVDLIAQPGGATRSTRTVRRHVGRSGDLVEIDGLLATDLATTVIDVARDGNLERAIVVADASLNPEVRAGLAVTVAEPDLRAAADIVPRYHGSSRARYVAEFADGRAGSPGESLSRLTIARIGLPKPELQAEFAREGGGCWTVDFWWPELGMIGEFDGKGKYLDPALRGGRTPAEVVFQEKLREDQLRRQVARFARWGWAEARSPELLLTRLRQSGLPAVFASVPRPRTR